jgi:hypothetical protein
MSFAGQAISTVCAPQKIFLGFARRPAEWVPPLRLFNPNCFACAARRRDGIAAAWRRGGFLQSMAQKPFHLGGAANFVEIVSRIIVFGNGMIGME